MRAEHVQPRSFLLRAEPCAPEVRRAQALIASAAAPGGVPSSPLHRPAKQRVILTNADRARTLASEKWSILNASVANSKVCTVRRRGYFLRLAA
jgi:hypothetical protein